MAMRVGYIGIGAMGCGIVKHLRKGGFPVAFIVHRNRTRVEELTGCGAVEVQDYAALAAEGDIIMLTVPDSSVVEPLLIGEDGIGPHLEKGKIVVDMSTSYPASTLNIAEALDSRGIHFLDAPLTGSKPEAESGRVNVICGGPKEIYDKVKPLFDAFAAHVFHVGPIGSGHVIKLINNLLGQANVAAICEMLPLAQKLGVDLQALFDVVSVSGGNSKIFQSMVPKLRKRDFTLAFKQELVHKDLRYITNLAREHGIPAPLACGLLSLHDIVLARGYGKQDFRTLLKFWEEVSGVVVRGPEA